MGLWPKCQRLQHLYDKDIHIFIACQGVEVEVYNRRVISSYFNNHKLTIEYNTQGGLPLRCICCGKLCLRERRIDTVALFDETEVSFCPNCWWKHLLDRKHLCKERDLVLDITRNPLWFTPLTLCGTCGTLYTDGSETRVTSYITKNTLINFLHLLN
jgi:hypothetical protein